MTEKTGKQAGILVALGVASVGYSYVCATVPERVRGETSFRVVLGVAYTLGAVVALVALGGRKGEAWRVAKLSALGFSVAGLPMVLGNMTTTQRGKK
jgi:hypothetical protein